MMFVDPHTQSGEFFSTLHEHHDSVRARLALLSDSSIEELQRAKLRLISEGRSFTDLSMINPDMPPHRYLLDRLFEATHDPKNHRYAVARGVRKLRSAIATRYERAFKVGLDPETQVCITMGAKDAALHVLQCLFEKNARLLLPAPTYPAHLAAGILNGYEIDTFEVSRDEEQMFQRIEECLRAEEYRAVFLNFPHNPTGVTVSSDFYIKLRRLLRSGKKKTFLINDFVYGEMPLGLADEVSSKSYSNCPSLLSAHVDDCDDMVEIYSMSKAYSVPGWRVGALCGDRKIVRLMSEYKAYLDYGVFLPLQYAAASALTTEKDVVGELRDNYSNRCACVIKGLKALGWEVTAPMGGVSVWARIPEASNTLRSAEYCKRLLLEKQVLLMPGRLFGEKYDSFVRIALVRPEEELTHVLAQMSEFSKEL